MDPIGRTRPDELAADRHSSLILSGFVHAVRSALPVIAALRTGFEPKRLLAPLAIFALLLHPGCQRIDTLVEVATVEEQPDDAKWRPFGRFAQLPDPAAPAPPGPATVVHGSGEFLDRTGSVGQPSGGQPKGGTGRNGRTTTGETHTINLVNATVPEAAKAILGDIFRVNYVVDPKIESRITVQTSQPVSRAGLAELFETALRTNGLAVVQTGNVYRIVTVDQAPMGARIGLNGGNPGELGSSVKIVPLRYISPAEMKRVLDPLAVFGGVVRVDEARNAIILSGTQQELASMEEAISVFDVDVMKGMSFAVVPVSAVEPDAIVDDLTKMFAADREGPMSGMVQFIANKRLKSILIISKQPRYLTQARQWVQKLDARARGTQKQFFTYMLRNRQAKEVVEVLTSVFRTETSTEEVAPRTRRAGDPAGPPPTPQFSTTATPGGAQTLVQQSFSAFGVTPQSTPPQPSAPSVDETAASPTTAIPSTGEPRIKIVADVPNNSLIIRATHHDYKRVERVIANLDVVPNQVLIEATICEVTLNDDLRFGVRWHLQNRSGTNSATFSSALDGAISSVFPGFSWVYKAANVKLTLNALNEVTRVNVLASPALTVLDGRTAHLQIGDQVPITTQTAISAISPGAPIVNSVSYRDTGVILSVTPRVNEAGRVLLDIEQEVSNVTPTTSSNIDSPTFGRRRVKTTVLVRDGDSITLGGLIHDRKSVADAQVPVLGNIPLVGTIFRDRDHKIDKTELIIFLTPKVVRDFTEAQEATQEYRRRIEAFTPARRHPRQLEHDLKRITK
ncbi:MAG: type II secretion system secretin GspD [Hyphomicrobiales bacterium]|nr:type II secretion system secretin GspD [Hyphomicrobiales bacterium]